MRKPGRAMVLGALLGGSGVLHLVRPRTYEWLVPPELGSARAWVAAWLLVGFVPAHVHTFRVIPKKPVPLAVAAVRLPLQVPLVQAALKVARAG